MDVKKDILDSLKIRRAIDLNIEECKECIRQIGDEVIDARQLDGISYDSIGGGGSGNIADTTANVAIKILDDYGLELLMHKSELKKLLHIRKEIDTMIYSLTGIERQVIIQRYMYSADWKDVAKKVGYSRSQTLRSHNAAINELVKNKIRELEVMGIM